MVFVFSGKFAKMAYWWKSPRPASHSFWPWYWSFLEWY